LFHLSRIGPQTDVPQRHPFPIHRRGAALTASNDRIAAADDETKICHEMETKPFTTCARQTQAANPEVIAHLPPSSFQDVVGDNGLPRRVTMKRLVRRTGASR
jgi:hypothetical protein